MLVLTRKEHEVVVINDNITVTVVEVRGNKVLLGFEAPKGVSIHRQEIWLEMYAATKGNKNEHR